MTLSDSYDAAEDNEISFREGDRITEIEAASEDWWQGKDKSGNIGLFPGENSFSPSSCIVGNNNNNNNVSLYSELRGGARVNSVKDIGILSSTRLG